MVYRKFKISNFKGINSLTLDFKKEKILTLIGLNESGKTTIMRAISSLYQELKSKGLNQEQIKEMRPKGGDFTGSISLTMDLDYEEGDKTSILEKIKEKYPKAEVTFESNTFSSTIDYNFELHTYKDKSHNIGLNIQIKEGRKKATSLFKFDRELWNSITNYIEKELIPEVLYYDDFIFEIPKEVKFSISTGELVGTQQAAQKESHEEWSRVLNDIIRSENEKFNFINDVVKKWNSDKEAARNRVARMESQLNNKITVSWKDLFEGKDLNFQEIKIDSEQNGDTLSFSFKVKDESSRIFDINERSKGCKWFFSFLLFTEFRKNRSANILFLLDEPASNLHSLAQEKILQALERLSDRASVIYSTHSQHLINPKWLKGVHIVKNDLLTAESLSGHMSTSEGAKISATKFGSYINNGENDGKFSHFQPLLDALSYRPALIENVPNIMITEGINDWYTFSYFIKLVFPEKNYPLHIYPGKGAGDLDEIIRLYLAWNRPFVVILDGDQEGKKQKERYLELFGEVLRARIFTLFDLFQENKRTEDLFEDSDKNLICDGAEPSKKNLNSCIITCLMEGKIIDISKTTRDRFEKIFNLVVEKMSIP